MPYQDTNQETIDRLISEGWEWGQPISHHQFEEAAKGNGILCSPQQKKFPINGLAMLPGKKFWAWQQGAASKCPSWLL